MTSPEPVPVASRTVADITARCEAAGVRWTYQLWPNGKDGIRHMWGIVGERGGIHTWGYWSEHDREWLGGIECHSPTPSYDGDGEPSQPHCWLINKPCWHDGSSLQFSEEIAPMLPRPNGDPMPMSVLSGVLAIMLHRYRIWLPPALTGDPA